MQFRRGSQGFRHKRLRECQTSRDSRVPIRIREFRPMIQNREFPLLILNHFPLRR
jgi:hypothetical protein